MVIPGRDFDKEYVSATLESAFWSNPTRSAHGPVWPKSELLAKA
ncbi:hypothetical protein ACIA8C_15485 [Nocardia sp. NPDC051321]